MKRQARFLLILGVVFLMNNDSMAMESLERYCSDAQSDGMHLTYNEKGQVQSEAMCVDKKVKGSIKFYFYYESTRLRSVFSFKNGIDGEYREYHTRGTLACLKTYLNGQLNGPARFYTKEGKIYAEENYKDGKLDGALTQYYQTGKVQSITVYKEGQLLLQRGYDPKDGRLIYLEKKEKSPEPAP